MDLEKLERQTLMNREANQSPVNCYAVGGQFGDRIEWSDTEQFDDMETRKEFRCHGWKTPRPKICDKLKAEFKRSWIEFEFVDVEYCSDPTDMFFAKVRPVKQTMKE